MRYYLNYVCNGITVSREAIGIDTILRVGIGGDYVSEPHTSEYLRSCYWRPGLFNRDSWDQWQAKGAKDTLTLAHEKVEALLRQHYPPEQIIGDDKFVELESYIGFQLRQKLGM